MNPNQFRDTFSAVRASDTLRLEVLQMTRKTTGRPGRLLPKVLLAAVILALLSTTAFAATKLFNALKGGEASFQSSQWYAASGSPDEGPYNAYDIYIDVEIHPDAPKAIDAYYIPVPDAGYFGYLGTASESTTQFGWANAPGKAKILFLQYAGGRFDPEKPVARLFTSTAEAPHAKLVDMDGISGYLVEDTNRRHFYWSDGDYVFQLTVWDDFTDAQLEALVNSVQYVPSIEPYLVPEEVYQEFIYGKKN